MNEFNKGSLQIKVQKDGNRVVMSWIGRSEDRDPAILLNPYLEEMVEKIKNNELAIEFLKLEYMNSSTVPPIIHFIKNLEINGIRTKVFYDKNSKWQLTSFKALEQVANRMKNIAVEGK